MEFLCKKSKKSGVECPQGKKCAPLHVTNMRSIRISASGGDDDRRRAFPPPRRWWQLCETPYFATRGRGEMRGVPNRSTSIAPRRWCGAVLPLWFYVYHFVCQRCKTWSCGAMTACHHLRGGIFGTPFGGPRMSPTPRSAKSGATHSDNRLPGLEITSPWVFSPLQSEWRRWHPMPDDASPL